MTATSSLLSATLTPREDGTLDQFLTYGEGTPTFSRDSTALVRNWEGGYESLAIDVPRWQGARYSFSGAIAHWELADETPLHPVRTVTHEGVNMEVFDHYRTRADSTAYVAGNRVIPASGGGTAGGNGFWYECTAGGTSDTAEPVWPTTVDLTVIDGGVTWKCGGNYRIDGVVIGQTRTNAIIHSRDLTAWAKSGSITTVRDSVGIDGASNTATTVTDTSSTVRESLKLPAGLTIPDDSALYALAVFIAKDNDESRFPEIRISFSGGTASTIRGQVNTKTGATWQLGGTSIVALDEGDFWRVILVGANNNSGNTALQAWLFPSHGSTLGGGDDTLTGSAIFDQVDLRQNTSLMDSPIITAGSAVTRDADILTIPIAGNFNDAGGLLLADFRPADWAAPAGYILGDAAGYVLAPSATDSGATAYDGTNTALGPTGTPSNMVRASSQWTSDVMSVSVNGTAGAEVAYDGSFDLAANVPIGSGYQGTVRNVRIFR